MKRLNRLCGVLAFMALMVACTPAKPEPGPESKTPAVNITTNGGQLELTFKDTLAVFDYEIVNPVKGESPATVLVEVFEGDTYVTEIEQDEYITTGTVTLSLDKNLSGEDHTIIVFVKYVYGENADVAQGAMTIVHKAEFSYNVTLTKALSTYYGEAGGDSGLYNYEVILGNPTYYLGGGVQIYALDLYSDERTEDMLPPAGTYTLVDEMGVGISDMTMSQGYTYYQRVNSDNTELEAFASFAEGTVTIEREGETYTIVGEFIDGGDVYHYVYYQGTIDARDGSKLSSFVKDTEFDFTGLKGEYKCFLDAFGNGNNVWSLSFTTESLLAGSPMVSMQIVTSADYNSETGLPSATFNADTKNTYDVNTFSPGFVDEEDGSFVCCWFFTCAADGSMRISDPVAPMKDGSIKIENNGDGTIDIIFDVKDDAGHKLTGRAENVSMKYIN